MLHIEFLDLLLVVGIQDFQNDRSLSQAESGARTRAAGAANRPAARSSHGSGQRA